MLKTADNSSSILILDLKSLLHAGKRLRLPISPRSKILIGRRKKSELIAKAEQEKLALEFKELKERVAALDKATSTLERTYAKEINSDFKNNETYLLLISILRALSPIISQKPLETLKRTATKMYQVVHQSFDRLFRDPFSSLAKKAIENPLERAWWTRECMRETQEMLSQKIRTSLRTEPSEELVIRKQEILENTNKEFKCFIEKMFAQIAKEEKSLSIEDWAIKRLSLSESDRPIVKDFIKQISNDPFKTPLLKPGPSHDPKSKTPEHAEMLFPYAFYEAKGFIQRVLRIINEFKNTPKPLTNEPESALKNSVETLIKHVNNLIGFLDLENNDHNQAFLKRVLENPSAMNIKELMEIIRKSQLDEADDPIECPLASYLPLAKQGMCRITNDPLLECLLGEDGPKWKSFITEAFELAHKSMFLEEVVNRNISGNGITPHEEKDEVNVSLMRICKTLNSIIPPT